MADNMQASASYHQETTASAQTVWQSFQAVAEWHQWNAGVHTCELDGQFVEGAWMTMVLPDQETIRSQLVEVRAPHSFTDETVLGDVTVRVQHTVQALANGNHRITYAIDVVGPDAADICAGVSADFPDVMRALAARAESQASQ